GACRRVPARLSERATGVRRRVRDPSLVSEPLREDQGEDEVAQQGDGHDEADDVLGGHSSVTPLAARATNTKPAIVTRTKATSAIANSWSEDRLIRTIRGKRIRGRIRPVVDAPLTAGPTALTEP